jgi:hypothetical protein
MTKSSNDITNELKKQTKVCGQISPKLSNIRNEWRL